MEINMSDWQIKKLKYFLKVKHGKDQKLIEDKNGIYPILASGGEIGKTNNYIYNKIDLNVDADDMSYDIFNKIIEMLKNN